MRGFRRRALRAKGSESVARGARLGMLGRSVFWLTLTLLTVQVVLGRDARTDQQGALRAIAQQPLGEALLGVIGGGLAVYAVHQALTAVTARRWSRRLIAAGKAVLYSVVALMTVFFLTGDGGAGREEPLGARVMRASGGRTLVGAVGVAAVGFALVSAWRAARSRLDDEMDLAGVAHRTRLVVRASRAAGLLGRGLVVGIVGLFLLRAAWQFEPSEAKGLDAALQTLRDRPYGAVLLLVAAVGMAAYALWSCVEARFRKL